MRRTKARLMVENLENRALLTTRAGFALPPPQVVSDQVGTVDVSIQLFSDDANAPTPETVTVATTGLTAVPGVDFTPVQQTIALTPDRSTTVSIPILPAPASLGTRTLLVSVSPTAGAPQGESQLIAITHGADATPPHVVSSQALTDGGKVVAFSLQFSEPMAIGPVTDPANYGSAAPRSVREIAEGALNYGTSATYSKNIPLKSVIYDAASNTVYLVPTDRVKPGRFRTPYPFQVASPAPASASGFSNLTDTSGNPVASGEPGNLFTTVGRFAATPRVTKASPSVLSYLSITPKARPKPAHRAGRIARQ